MYQDLSILPCSPSHGISLSASKQQRGSTLSSIHVERRHHGVLLRDLIEANVFKNETQESPTPMTTLHHFHMCGHIHTCMYYRNNTDVL